tara:strand:- start:541 stop:654 length:114 start_codon:yes stop_codon:yes gene_type:complete
MYVSVLCMTLVADHLKEWITTGITTAHIAIDIYYKVL